MSVSRRVRSSAAGALGALAFSLSSAQYQPASPCNTAVSHPSDMAYVPGWAPTAWLVAPGCCRVSGNSHPFKILTAARQA